MKARSEVATRYAKALFSLAHNGKRETILEDLRKAREILFTNDQTRQLITSPVITRKEKGLIVENLVGSQKLMDEVANFVRLLAQKDRLQLVDQIVDAFEEITDVSNNVVRGVVSAPTKVNAEEKRGIETAISKVINRQLILEYKEDKNVVGGVIAHVGSYSFDGSLKTGLKKLRERLRTQ